MDLGISERTALVMSSTSGLGFGCAAALVAEGVRVVINGRDAERGKAAQARLGSDALFVRADVGRADDRERLFREARAHLGTVSILVTNAAGPRSGPSADRSSEQWRAAFELTVVSALEMVRMCLPEMVHGGFGRIVSISSTSAKEVTPGASLANGVRPGLVGALAAIAREMAATGVTVNSLLAGPFDTDLMRGVASRAIGRADLSPAEAIRVYGEGRPMRRVGAIEEFGALCAFLCSRRAAYITGQSIVIDGGQTPALL